MKKEMSFNEILGVKLATIRKQYESRAEKFYDKYLAAVSDRQLNKGSSKDDHMSKLETGKITCPPQYLPIYAQLGSCTIEDLVNIEPLPDQTPVTYKSLAAAVDYAMRCGVLTYQPAAAGQLAALSIPCEVLCHLVEILAGYNALGESGGLSWDDVDHLSERALADYGVQLFDYSMTWDDRPSIYAWEREQDGLSIGDAFQYAAGSRKG